MLDPKQRYLIQDGSGQIYIRTEKLAKRKDMKEYDPVSKGKAFEPNEATTKKRVEIELQGKTFLVEQELYDVLTEMGSAMVALQQEIAALKPEAEPAPEKEKTKGKK